MKKEFIPIFDNLAKEIDALPYETEREKAEFFDEIECFECDKHLKKCDKHGTKKIIELLEEINYKLDRK